MSVLVTGGSGFIGRHVIARLQADGVDVIAVRHRWRSIADLADQIGGRRVDRVIHLGWYMDPADCMTSVAGNAESFCSSVELLTYLMGAGPPHLVVAGSWWERAYPASAYGQFKRALHRLLTDAYGPLGLRFFWANLQTVVGAGDNPCRVLPTVARAVAGGDPVDLSSGEQVRDYIDVRDAAAALCAASSSQTEGTFDIGTGVGTTLKAMCLAIAHELHAPTPLLRFGARPYLIDECMEAVADSLPFRAATGWAPSTGPAELARRIAHDRTAAGSATGPSPHRADEILDAGDHR